MQLQRIRAQIDHPNVPPGGFFDNEGSTLLKYDRSIKQYTLDIEDIPLEVRNRFTEDKFTEAVTNLNELLRKESARPPLGLRPRMSLLLFLLSFMFLIAAMGLMLKENNQSLEILGLVCILLALISISPVFYFCTRSIVFKGSYFFFTPKVKNLLQELNKTFEPKKVKWALGKRVIGSSKKREYEAFDLVFIVWSEGAFEANVQIRLTTNPNSNSH